MKGPFLVLILALRSDPGGIGDIPGALAIGARMGFTF